MPDKSNVVKLPGRAPEPAAAPSAAGTRSRPGIIDQALEYWNRLRAGRPMPARADLSPGDIPKLLPYVILMDVLHGPLDFRYRLIGTEIDRVCRRNYKGAKMSELPDKRSPNPIWLHHQEAVETRAPVRRELSYVGPDGDVKRVAHCLMPFSADGARVDHILVAVDIERRG
jgi:hypothetical protein